MKLLYTHANRLLVANAKNITKNAGIAVTLKNEFASGGAGDLAPHDTWLELWVLNAADYPKAKRLLEQYADTSNRKNWLCSHCREENGAAFEFCWNCQQPH